MIKWYIRGIFSPFNKLKVRNVGRRYSCDMDIYLIHAAFSVLCRHVERAEGGLERLRERKALLDNSNEHEAAWHDAFTTMIRLYEWYTSINWADPFPFPSRGTREEQLAAIEAEDELFGKIANEKLMELVRIRGFMWT